ncbi:MAG: serine protease AprX, partial [Ulvibacter sp.]
SGTSFSSPIIAGAVASLWQARPEVPNGLIMQVIRESAHLFNNPTDQMGYGIPNFEDALNDLLVLGVEDQLLKEQFAIYPNPVKTNVNISFPEGVEQADFIIYNIIGEQILNSKISKVNNWLDLSELVSGMYFATIKSDSRTNSFKLIKE